MLFIQAEFFEHKHCTNPIEWNNVAKQGYIDEWQNRNGSKLIINLSDFP